MLLHFNRLKEINRPNSETVVTSLSNIIKVTRAHQSEFHNAEFQNAECHYAEWHYA